MIRALFPAVCLAVATSLAAAQQIPLRSLGSDEGVGTVYALARSEDGLWMGTSDGLARYDGARVVADALPLPARHGVRALDVSPGGLVWAWAPPHLVLRTPDGALRRVAVPEALAGALRLHHDRLVVQALHSGGVAVSSPSGGLWLRTRGRWRHLLRDGVQDVARDGPILWVVTRDRLGRVDLRRPDAPTWFHEPVRAGRHVRPHPDGAWLATGAGLYIAHRDGRRTTVLGDSARCWFTTPGVDASGALALTVETRNLTFTVVEPDGRMRLQVPAGRGLRTMSTNAAGFDDEGGLFVGSHLGLAYIEDPDRIQLLPLSDVYGVSDLGVSPGDGALWVTTYGGGVFRHDGTALRTVRAEDRASTGRVAVHLRLRADGTAHWVEVGPGLTPTAWRSDGGPAERLGTGPFPVFAGPPALFTRPENTTVLFRRDGAVVSRDGPVHHPQAWVADGQRSWFSLDTHLESLDGGQTSRTSPATPPSVRAILTRTHDRIVTGVATDAAGRVWVGTLDGLLLLRERADGAWEAVEMETLDSSLAVRVEHVAVYRDHLWVATLDGVRGYRVIGDRPDLVPLATPGLDSALPARAIYRIAETRGALWVLPQGPPTLVRYRPGRVLASPPVRLSEARVNGWRVAAPPPGRALRMHADTSRVALAFAPTSFRRAADVSVEYRLDDGPWVRFEGEPTLRLAAVAPGRHVVAARARRPGAEPGPMYTVALDVRPPFYRATWFEVLVGMLMLGAGLGLAQRRVRQGETRERALQTTVSERTEALATTLSTVEAQAAQLIEMDAARTRFFQNISHELRTPLALILGPLADARSGRTDPGVLHTQVPVMERNARRLRRLVDALLDLARLDAGHLRLYARPTDVARHVRTTVASFEGRAEQIGVGLSVHAGPDAFTAWVDRDRLEEVVSNLVSNALKFTPAGGTVRVDVSATEREAVVRVADTGRGIAPDLLPHVFERFRQADDAATSPAEGVGIGLALVHEIVSRHGGTVDAESTPGVGSRFTVSLPLRPDALPDDVVRVPDDPEDDADERLATGDGLPAPTAVAAANGTADAARPSVLVVEDHPDLRDYLRSILAPTYRVREAANGRAGLDAALDAPPDLVLSDVMMPEMDGLALCRALKAAARTAHVPVVLLTARTDEASRLEGLAGGADDYLGKPFSASELLARCENLIELRRRLQQRLSNRAPASPENLPAPPESAWAADARAAVEAHLGDLQFGVDWLADALGTSARTLHRQCRSETGLTPAAFIRSVRLEHAALLLREGAASIAAVAAAVGYADAGHFARRFRQAFGVTPSDYASDVEV